MHHRHHQHRAPHHATAAQHAKASATVGGDLLVAAAVTHLRTRLAALPVRWRWTPHNLLAHPLSEVLYQFGARDLAALVHDATVPMGGERDPEARG